jgi:hypothetical protein
VGSGSGGAQWVATFAAVPALAKSLTVTVTGHSSSSCTQNVNVWNWYYSAWVTISNRGLGTTNTTVAPSVVGLLSDYVFMGELRASIQCFRTDNAPFDLSTDLLKLNYTT